MTISDEHRQRLRAKHETDPTFGVIGHLWAPRIGAFLEEISARSYLDYGCGRSNLMKKLVERNEHYPMVEEYAEYDPVFHRVLPRPADFVSCIDVLEHVEADQLDAVMEDLKRVTLKAGLITISLRNATLKGRHTHPIVKPRDWWEDKIGNYFRRLTELAVLDPEKAKSEIAFLVRVT